MRALSGLRGHRITALLVTIAAVFLLAVRRADAYSVLSHEEVVDLAWPAQIVPLLKARYPGLTDEQLRTAHAYAYGGSIIQDIGYYPFGSHQFSDMVHYVRSGDFVATMIRESSDPNELAFALGALAHYCGDVEGHPTVNLVTSQQNPKLRKKYGQVVTYDENPVAHVRTEFGFDVVEVAHGRYSQENYRNFIGFEVAKPLMERAFLETYGIPVSAIMKNEDLAVGSYRWTVSSLIPKMTKVALVSYKGDIEKESPGFDHKKFIYRLKRTEFEQTYGRQYEKPGFGTRVLALFIAMLPKVGPLRSLQVKMPDSAQQDLYLKSMNHTVDQYDHYLAGMTLQTAAETTVMTAPELKEIDLDTGQLAAFGEYQLADESYGDLLDMLLHDPKVPMKADVRQSFVDFYATRNEPEWYTNKPKDWERLQVDLKTFDAAGTANAVAAVVGGADHERFDSDVVRAHKHSSCHRVELESSSLCGCFHCFSLFPPSDILEWIDEGQTALCPRSPVDEVIGTASGYPITEEFLKKMGAHWF